MYDSPAKDSKGDQRQGGTKQDDFFDSWEEVLSGFAGAGWNYCFPGFNSLLAFSAPEDLARRCAFLCKTNIEMRILRHTVAGRR